MCHLLRKNIYVNTYMYIIFTNLFILCSHLHVYLRKALSSPSLRLLQPSGKWCRRSDAFVILPKTIRFPMVSSINKCFTLGIMKQRGSSCSSCRTCQSSFWHRRVQTDVCRNALLMVLSIHSRLTYMPHLSTMESLCGHWQMYRYDRVCLKRKMTGHFCPNFFVGLTRCTL